MAVTNLMFFPCLSELLVSLDSTVHHVHAIYLTWLTRDLDTLAVLFHLSYTFFL